VGDIYGIGALAGAGVQAAGGVEQMQMQTKSTRHARNRAERMSNTVYRRAVRDLEKAGLNPALAFGHLNTSAPVTAVPHYENIGKGMAEFGSSSAKAFSKLRAELKILASQAEIASNAAEASQYDKSRAYNAMLESAHAADLRSRQASLTTAQEAQTKMGTTSTEIQNRLDASRIPGAEAQMHFDETKAGEVLRVINRAVRSVTGSDTTSAR